jgi:hypothetical protein
MSKERSLRDSSGSPMKEQNRVQRISGMNSSQGARGWVWEYSKIVDK